MTKMQFGALFFLIAGGIEEAAWRSQHTIVELVSAFVFCLLAFGFAWRAFSEPSTR